MSRGVASAPGVSEIRSSIATGSASETFSETKAGAEIVPPAVTRYVNESGPTWPGFGWYCSGWSPPTNFTVPPAAVVFV